MSQPHWSWFVISADIFPTSLLMMLLSPANGFEALNSTWEESSVKCVLIVC